MSERWTAAIDALAWRTIRAAAIGHARATEAIAGARERRSRPDQVRKICLFAAIANRDNPHVPGLGDLISKNLFLKLLRQAYPNARLYCVAGPNLLRRYRDFMLKHGYIDEVVECPEPGARAPRRWIALIRTLRRQRFDLCVIDPSSTGLRAIQAYLSGIRERVGVPLDPVEAVFVNRTVALDFAQAGRFPDLLDSTRAFAEAAGVDIGLHVPGPGRCFPYVADEAHEQRRGLRIAVHIGGDAHWNRRWPLTHYRELCARLCRIDGAGVVLVGGASEAAEIASLRAAVIAADPAADIHDASGGSLNHMAAQLDRADLFVGNDSAPMHIAAALGKPVVVPCGPIGPELWQRMYAARVVRGEHACSRPSAFSLQRHGQRQFSCAEFHCPYAYDPRDPTYPRCLSDTGVQQVFDAVLDSVAARCGANASAASRC
ncbi:MULTISPECIES: glycosyltransferase family 9 protein [Xanthomonas]|uniref:Glycosyltransferase family 9 protein n=1 Tax=Xanthomonas hortorum pv. hederae TaxID=453603 RepID=A0A9X4H6N3_9XANT|nr:glycosyltransferase family 9 protein [Xanthomonas arboricola]MDC8638892.1 glycosyltransferase family 9 protein [Xanthomonas hortorum pv. hederae]QDS16108.1 glycosyltransferase family 9 protein [Xanthomonas arboricola]